VDSVRDAHSLSEGMNIEFFEEVGVKVEENISRNFMF
jgi:hypothetical protein